MSESEKLSFLVEAGGLDALAELVAYVLHDKPPNRISDTLNRIALHLRRAGIDAPLPTNTPYVNTISVDDEPIYPGDQEIERRIKSYIRWNAMAMVVNANRDRHGIGGHISTYASLATLYEVGYNHFFQGAKDGRPSDQIYFQGHAAPGNYARAYLEGRIDAQALHNFRNELAEGGGLSSYPHPYLMPDFWQFPTVSMGLGPITSVYRARFNKYLEARGLFQGEQPKVWAYVGDGEMDEPESMAALTLAGREQLANLIWIVNCNLQRLDGPVRGNGKIIQELEALFRGAGWNVIKLIWGSDWDPLLEQDKDGLLVRRMEEAVDGDYQTYTVEHGSYTRRRFFGKYPELLNLVDHLTDDQIQKLRRGGHDPKKTYAAYSKAVEDDGRPTVILAKTIKGYGLGEAGEGRNITHQQKELNERELREFRRRFDIPISDEKIAEAPFYRPPVDSPEASYIRQRRKALGGWLPKRESKAPPLNTPDLDFFRDQVNANGRDASTTGAFAQALAKLMRDKEIGRRIVPIIPDEARTFGMDAMFSTFGIYSPKGQLYDPVDRDHLLYYREAKDGQTLEEGINEAGAMSEFIAAGTTYATHGVNMMPFFIYYSMFGFQRVGDLVWAAADSRTKGFLLGGTAGRTTLAGEGLQHQDGHGHLFAGTVPTLLPYDPAYAYELAVILQDGMRRMFAENEEIFYYLTLYNEKYEMPNMPEGVERGILKGLYKYRASEATAGLRAHLFGSGPILNEALRAQELLAERYGVSADVWSATSYTMLRRDAHEVERRNMLHPTEEPRRSYLDNALEGEEGVVVAVSDNARAIPDQIAPWMPEGFLTLGTDGFGRSDTREGLRRLFGVDSESIAVATLYALSRRGEIEAGKVGKAIRELGIDTERPHPMCEMRSWIGN